MNRIQSTFDYDNELNKRLETRYVPSGTLQPLYDFRPVSTKYTIFHTIDKPIQSSQVQSTYNPYEIFNPGDRAPIDYFMKNVDVESTLRSQFFALQNDPQAVYVPEFNSQLYENSMAYSPEFFSPTDAKTFTKNQDNEIQTIFYNNVRSNSRK
jgi:hypothetical protein